MSTTSTTDGFDPLTTLDCELVDLGAASQLLSHLATTDLEIGAGEINTIVTMVDRAHDKIEVAYNRARELFQAQKEAHRAALAEAQAATAAPGSPADIKRAESLWRLLRVMANAAIEQCDEAQGITAAGQ